jgi:hypothetical protein
MSTTTIIPSYMKRLVVTAKTLTSIQKLDIASSQNSLIRDVVNVAEEAAVTVHIIMSMSKIRSQ